MLLVVFDEILNVPYDLFLSHLLRMSTAVLLEKVLPLDFAIFGRLGVLGGRYSVHACILPGAHLQLLKILLLKRTGIDVLREFSFDTLF